MNWKHIKQQLGTQSLPNLHVLSDATGKELGFIQKPRDTSTDRSFWRVFKGIGENAKLVDIALTRRAAKIMLVKSL